MRHSKGDRAVQVQDRRATQRHDVKAPLRVRVWKSTVPEQVGESENISEDGILFATDVDLPIGTVVEVFLRTPEQITGEPSAEWRCTGHVVRVEPIASPQGTRGISVQFDCYQVSKY